MMNQSFEQSQGRAQESSGEGAAEGCGCEGGEAQDAEKVASEKDEVRVLEVGETLKDDFEARDKHQVEETRAKEDLKKLHLAHSELQIAAQSNRLVLQQVGQTSEGKLYLMQCVFGTKGSLGLTQVRCSTKVFTDFPKSVTDVVQHSKQLEGHEEKTFWLQFREFPSSQLLNHRMEQLVDLFCMARLVLQDRA
ncbi:hypothetical protein D1007_32914 [Hordeum vulgare]|nr:hypothetical protein D1007_32914 [Hordeum vulgare]